MPSQETIEAINAASVLVLVIVTGFYVVFTYRILKANQRQAHSAEETLRLLKQQTEELTGFGRRQIEMVIKETLETIQYWKNEDLQNRVFSRLLPENPNLLSGSHKSALENANRISSSLSSLLSDGFQEIRSAQDQLFIMRVGHDLHALFGKHGPQFLEYLDNAQEHLEKAQLELHSSLP